MSFPKMIMGMATQPSVLKDIADEILTPMLGEFKYLDGPAGPVLRGGMLAFTNEHYQRAMVDGEYLCVVPLRWLGVVTGINQNRVLIYVNVVRC